MKRIHIATSAAAIAVGLACASSASGALSLTLVNPGFEDLTGSTTLFNQDVPGWSDYDGAVGSGAGWFNKTVIDETHPAWATTPWSGNGVGMLAVYDTGQDEAWMFQSLGSVGAADVGKTFIMTADFAFRQGGTRWTDSDMTVAFMSGITDTGTYGTVLGTAGVRNFVTDINGTVPIPFESRTATFTPLAEDVGTEVFAVLAIQQYDTGGSTGARQGIVDNVTLGSGAVPTLAVSHDGTALDFSWESRTGKVYDLLSATGLATDPATWPVYQTYQDIAASGTGTNTLDDVPLDGTVRFFAIAERDAPPPPPLLDENFDDDNGGFTSVDKGSGSVWDWDDPDSSSPGGVVTTGNGGAGKCWGTDTGNPGQYTTGTDTCLRSPVFDLTGVTGAVLTFAHARDINTGDTAIINIIDDTTEDVIAELFNEGDDDINTANWTNAGPIAIPDEIEEAVRLEFRFTGAGPDEWMGWYIDDVKIEVP